MDERIVRLLARRVRPSKVAAARNAYVAMTAIQSFAVPSLFLLMLDMSPPAAPWLMTVALVVCLLNGAAACRFQRTLGESAFLCFFVACVASIPGVSFVLLMSLLYESAAVVTLARRERLGLCHRCEYDLRQTPAGLPCPECGWRAEE